MGEIIGDVNTPPWQAQAMVEVRQADRLAAGDRARMAAAAPVMARRAPRWSNAVDRAGLFLIRNGERLRRDALRHRPASVS